jgi:alpha-tubulin suppressor-like RCC1 family protein
MAITYTSATPLVCDVVGTTVTIFGPGDCTIDADQPGGTNAGVVYNAATTITRTFKVKGTQWITFPIIGSKLYTLPDLDPSAVASSTLPVTLTSTTPSVCTIVSGKIHYVAPGTCSVTASQAGGVSGSVTYAAATDVTRSFPVLGLPQAITFPTVPPKRNYDPSFDLAGTTDSGLPVVYTSSTPMVCTVTGKKVTLFEKGTCTITASQPGGTTGGSTYAAATAVVRSFSVTDETPTPSRTATATATTTNTPTNTRTVTPTPIPNLLKKSAVGSSFVLGLLHSGTIITWGMNKEYQTNIPPCCGTGITDIAVGTNFALALKGGRVYGWGANTRGQVTIPMLAQKDVAAISAGYAHGLALKANGTVVCWGNNFFGQCNVPATIKGIKQVVGGQDHTLIRLSDSTVKGYGSNASNQITIPATLGVVTDISAGCDHSMAIKPNGMVVAWGGNKFMQSKVPTNLKDVKAIGAGCHYSMAMMHDGTLFGWGRNENNQVSIPKGITNAFSIGVGYVNSIIGLRDGSIIAIGAPEHGALVTRTPTP